MTYGTGDVVCRILKSSMCKGMCCLAQRDGSAQIFFGILDEAGQTHRVLCACGRSTRRGNYFHRRSTRRTVTGSKRTRCRERHEP